MPPYGAPEPDVVLTDAPQGDGYVPLESVALLIEVSDSTISYDLGPKAVMYATHGIPEYWVVDLLAAQIHQFWQPAEGAYQNSRSSTVGEALHSATLPAATIETDGIL
ncbi:Uma2 family endonuclease [Sphingomonas sp. ZT3P38]|uniref:Uma2 family endonuclease n=1 Tax=Parasphingomonas zepuensis TaxID=3096161 RepID=UPI002FCBD658